jgi:hypothetical protein
MSLEELESEALKLNPSSRARLAERLLRSLEDLAEEALRRHEEIDNGGVARPGKKVFRDAHSRLR